ncbi:uncharacterized protein LOC135155733 [Lytechinus pictus]|uniref:uncharacterized protein LOC135155733 n=1 Tax=Lytechinus pictus TaxID=7653 RepID=UPI0030B9E1B6
MWTNLKIEQDFEVGLLQNVASSRLYQNWSKTATKLIEWCPRIAPYALKDLLAGEDDLEVDELNTEQKNNLAFGLLPVLFPGRRKGKGGRYSTREAQLGFIDVQNENLALDKFLEDIVPESRPQPFILVIGSLLKPVQIFIIVERRALEQSSLMKAVDTCYKAVYVLDLEYQPQCCGAWEFLQTYIYEMKGAVKCSAIREFRIFETAYESIMNTNI